MTEAVHYPFPKIAQFRNVVKLAQKNFDTFMPTVVPYIGRIKTNGSNSSIVINKDGSFYAQSRKKIIHPDNDNYEFAKWVFANIVEIQEVVKNDIINTFADVESVVLYGEWIGNGVQSGVAVSKIHKTFIVFSIKVIYPNELEHFYNNFIEFEPNREIGLYHIDNFPTYEIDVDFKNPQAAQDLLVQYTKEVETHCPVGAYFGVDGIGEGLVFSPKYAYSHLTDFDYVFKSVGEKFSGLGITNYLSGIKLTAADEQKLINLCLQNNIKDFDFSFYEDHVC
jgi:hypothetical protein